jgi:hypothetical protein
MYDCTHQINKLRSIKPGSVVRLGEDRFKITSSIQLSAPTLPPAALHEATSQAGTTRWFWISQAPNNNWNVECWLKQSYDHIDPSLPRVEQNGHSSMLERRYAPRQDISYHYSHNGMTGVFSTIYYHRVLGDGAQIVFGRFDNQPWTRFDGYNIHMMGLIIE